MRNKVALAVSTALMTVSLSSTADINSSQVISALGAQEKTSTVSNNSVVKFITEKNLAAGEYTYIVRLKDMPLATYDGSIAGLTATNPNIAKKELFAELANSKMTSLQVRDALRLDTKSKEAVKYTNFLESKQKSFLAQAKSELGKEAKVVYQYKNAFNGMALRLTQTQAAKLATLNSVAFVERERMEQMDTDTGPIHIGAPQVWEGEGPTAINMGEGVKIGVIDSGINTDHRSFADIGDDGYDHTNPWGAGVYVGDCAGDFASLCNDKLIGIRSYASVTDNYDDKAVFGENPPAKNGEDYGGHGSHTASTAGGNILKNVPLVDQEIGKLEGDGVNTTGFEFGQISGVAPHANIIAYQICNPGNRAQTGPSDTYNGCPGAAIIAALDDAVTDGVDVLNYSISGGGNPWTSATELGFLAAQQAGIFAAVSAGNSGPNAGTTSKNAPWYTIVGASTHGRTVAFDKEIGNFTGGDTTLAALEGGSASGGITAKIVWAGDFTNSNDTTGDPEQCLQPFPAGTFNGEIVVCDRGAIARVAKAVNVKAGGAGGFVLGNIDGGANSVSNDVYVIPGIHMNAENGNALRSWLASGTDHMATITAADGELKIGQADDMASFSSRGPNNTVPDIMTPSVTAPGVSIYAAYADQHFGHDVLGTDPADFAFLQGTSMSAPHTSGAGAVLKSAHPTWTPDNIRSALMLTAVTNVRKEDGKTDADVFDMGSGSIRVNLATNTGLIMDETFANYIKADPRVAGTPSSLNIPSMANAQCIDTCTWTRTFTATKDASWAVTTNTPSTGTAEAPIPNDMKLTVTPTSFDIKAGETKTITVTADVSEADVDVWNFGDVMLTSPGIPSARLPVLVQISEDNLPSNLAILANRADGSITYPGLKSKNLSGVTAGAFQQKLKTEGTITVKQGFRHSVTVTLTDSAPLAVFTTSSVTAPDVDLEIKNAAGVLLGSSAGSNSNERVTLRDLPAGDYSVQLLGFTISDKVNGDATDLKVFTTEFKDDFASETVTASVTENATDFDLKLTWASAINSDGLVQLKGTVGESVTLPWSIALGKADIAVVATDDLTAGNQEMTPGVANRVSFDIEPNFTNEDKVYTLTADVTAGQEIANVDNDGDVTENTVTWSITRAVGESTEMLSVGFDLIPRTASTDNEIKLSNTLGSNTIESMFTFGVVEVAPVAAITGLSTTTEGSDVTVDGSTSSDANGNELTYSWVQLSGTPVSFNASSASLSFVAPQVQQDETISFELTVNDGNGNSDTTTASASIVNEKSSGGSFGWLMLLLTPMLFTRRKKV